MKRAYSSSAFLLVALVLLAGCKAGGTNANNPVKPASVALSNSNVANANHSNATANSNNNATAKEAAPTENPKPIGPPELLGTYESREVQENGVVTLISQLKTLWLFSSDGTYFRESQVKGKAYHADSGKFRIEAPNKLVLSIEVTGLKTQRKIQNPPLSKTHIFSLSPDGDELRLTSDKGSVGIFRRTAKAKTP